MKKINYLKKSIKPLSVILLLILIIQCDFKPKGWDVSVTVDLENYHFELSDITYEFKKINFSSYHNRNYKDYVVFVFNETASSLTLTESQKDSISSLLVGNNSFALRIEVSEKVKSSKPFNIPLRYYYESKFPVGVENLITLKPEFH